MPWCPKCNTEFVEEVETCSDCGERLVPQLLAEREDSNLPDMSEQDNSPAFLMSVENINIARMLESRLRQDGIPTLIKYKGAGEYLQIYMGGTPFGVDLYVPGSVLERARELLTPDEEITALPDLEEEDYAGDDSEEKFTEEESSVVDELLEEAPQEPKGRSYDHYLWEKPSGWKKLVGLFKGKK